MNMSEFINSIQLKISDLENIGKLGYVEGMSNIIIKQLNDTDLNKRPVHCSDAKRETLYVKEENKWEKDTQETKQMIKAVRGVDKKNYQMLNKWKDTHPKCMDSESKQSDEYMKIVSKVMDGDEENINKVIKKVAKEVVIEKPNKL
jgi:DNA-directed RNA polymerase specialized sigma subunit